MQHIDQVGNRPNIRIAPISFGDGDDCFEVAVSGMAVDA